LLSKKKNINKQNTQHVKFVTYSGNGHSLCCGYLCLNIDGEDYYFGYDWNFRGTNLLKSYDKPLYNPFWSSGGGFSNNYEPYREEWIINEDELPKQFVKYAEEIDEVFNANVPWGCCGGCV